MFRVSEEAAAASIDEAVRSPDRTGQDIRLALISDFARRIRAQAASVPERSGVDLATTIRQARDAAIDEAIRAMVRSDSVDDLRNVRNRTMALMQAIASDGTLRGALTDHRGLRDLIETVTPMEMAESARKDGMRRRDYRAFKTARIPAAPERTSRSTGQAPTRLPASLGVRAVLTALPAWSATPRQTDGDEKQSKGLHRVGNTYGRARTPDSMPLRITIYDGRPVRRLPSRKSAFRSAEWRALLHDRDHARDHAPGRERGGLTR